MSFPLFQTKQTKEGALVQWQKNFSMTSASEPNMSINQKLTLKKKIIKLAFMKYVAIKISVWGIRKN